MEGPTSRRRRVFAVSNDGVSERPANRWGTEVTVERVLGAPCRVFVDRPRHVGDLIRDGRVQPDHTYLIQGERRLTFAAHEAALATVRDALEHAGVKPGEAVMILGANEIELVTTFWATVRSGAVAVFGNAWWSESEVHAGLEVMKPRVVVCDEQRARHLPANVARITYDELRVATAEGGKVMDRAPAGVDEDSPSVVIFTSGTTGAAKAATLSHRGILATLQCLLVVAKRVPSPGISRRPGSVSLLSLPLFHIGGLQQIITAMATGGSLVFSEGRFDPAEIVALLRRENVKVWSAVPTMVSRVLDYLEGTGETLPALRTLGMGGASVSELVRDRARRAFPQAQKGIGVTWGLTEAGGAVTTGAGPEIAARRGSVGRLVSTAEIRVDHPNEDGTGEILVRSPSVMLHYWGTEGSPIDEDRWLRTGDIGWIDEDSYVYITDRAKDIIIRGGENIAAARVEEEISRHELVEQVAVVGLPHPDLGEQVGAIVKVRENAVLDLAALRATLGLSLARFEVPTQWWIYPDPLPQNAIGKIVKKDLRSAWIKNLANQVPPPANKLAPSEGVDTKSPLVEHPDN